MRSTIASFLVAASILAGGCMSNPPYRTTLTASATEKCERAYEAASWTGNTEQAGQDAEVRRIQLRIAADRKDPALADCWNTSREHHASYDLYSVEFDDQGWLAGKANPDAPRETQLTTLVSDLEAMSERGRAGEPLPLSVIIYTHGWHHSAAPDDANVIAFRHLLESAAAIERGLCMANRSLQPQEVPGAADTACTDAETGRAGPRKRRVVGIYVGWRGDSVLGPLIDNTSIWDRKLAAETVALGSVQEFFARMHNFFVSHACHVLSGSDPRRDDPKLCAADVRMLTIGHSFGGLITYRALAPRLMLGVAETTYRVTAKGKQRYAYGFGDLTVLINPAFEATRFEPLAEAAAARSYVGPDTGEDAQLPILIVATSSTDDATGLAFPMFRRLTTTFERVEGLERPANIETVGWDPRYQTHSLAFRDGPDACGLAKGATLKEKLAAEAAWSDSQRRSNYRMFDAPVLDLCDGLRLTKQRWGLEDRPFMPLWIIKADQTVIDGHNDFLNPRFVAFVRQVYYTILRQGDLQLQSSVGAKSH